MLDIKISTISRIANILGNTLNVYGACVQKTSVDSDIESLDSVINMRNESEKQLCVEENGLPSLPYQLSS